MAKFLNCVVCEKVITDRTTNVVSYINCVEELHAAQLPAPLPPLVLGSLWARESDTEENLEMRIRVSPPDGATKTFPVPIAVMDKQRKRYNVTIGGVLAEAEGTCLFELQVKRTGRWRRVWAFPVELKLAQPESRSLQPAEQPGAEA